MIVLRKNIIFSSANKATPYIERYSLLNNCNLANIHDHMYEFDVTKKRSPITLAAERFAITLASRLQLIFP